MSTPGVICPDGVLERNGFCDEGSDGIGADCAAGAAMEPNPGDCGSDVCDEADKQLAIIRAATTFKFSNLPPQTIAGYGSPLGLHAGGSNFRRAQWKAQALDAEPYIINAIVTNRAVMVLTGGSGNGKSGNRVIEGA